MQFQVSIFFRSSQIKSFEESLGSTKIPSTVYVNTTTKTIAFVNKSDLKCRTFVVMSEFQLERLAERNYQLFPKV